MIRTLAGAVALTIAIAALPGPAKAQDDAALGVGLASLAILAGGLLGQELDDSISVGAGDRPLNALLVGGAGYYDVIGDNEGDDGAGLFRAELRFPVEQWAVRPFVGVEATTSQSFYGYTGILVDVFVTDNFVLSPNFAVGLYAQGDARDLGSVVEFRSGVEAAYRWDNGARLGVVFHHISNAEIGDRNPGIETLSLNFAWPLY